MDPGHGPPTKPDIPQKWMGCPGLETAPRVEVCTRYLHLSSQRSPSSARPPAKTPLHSCTQPPAL